VLGAGGCFAGWILGTFTDVGVSPWLEHLLPWLCKAAIVVAVLRWPTGRLPARWARPFGLAVACYLAVGLASQFIGRRFPTPVLRAMPSVGSLVTGGMVAELTTALLSGVAPVLFLAATYRRRAGMPKGVRATSTPAFVAAGILGAAELWAFLSATLASPLGGRGGRVNTAGGLGFAVDVGRFGAVAVLLVCSEALRRRAANAQASKRAIELGPAAVDDVSADVARILGDPTAFLALRRPDGSWTKEGVDAAPAASTRRSRVEIADGRGRVVAAVDHDEAAVVSQVTRDALMASIGLAVVRSARQLAADHRWRALGRVQREVLDAQDRARRRLERDLHDGVQQRLVALALDASLLARHERAQAVSDDDRDELVESIEQTVAVIRDVLAGGTPGVLDRGLAAGLVALDATIPLTTRLTIDGDVAPDHPAALALWYVASEAVANSLKHAAAREITVQLHVDAHTAELTVADDGCGGIVSVPSAIVDRLHALASRLDVTSPPGRGTSIHVSVDLGTPVGAR
jgi:signal transduction histidine kinase